MSELSGSKSPALHDVAPYPGRDGTTPVNARTMGAHYAAFALMHHTLACDLLDTEDREGIKRSTNLSILSYGIAHLLNSLAEIGARGDQAALELWEDQRHPSSLGPDLRALLNEEGVDPEAVVKVAEEVAQRYRAAASPGQVEPEPGDVWKVSDGTVPIGGVSPESFVIHSDWNGGHPVAIVEIEDGRRAYGVTFAAWRDVRKPEGRSTIVRVPSDMQVTPCTLNGTTPAPLPLGEVLVSPVTKILAEGDTVTWQGHDDLWVVYEYEDDEHAWLHRPDVRMMPVLVNLGDPWQDVPEHRELAPVAQLSAGA